MKTKLRKILSCLLAVTAIIPAAAFSASADETEGIYTYRTEDGEAIISAIDKAAEGEITIPETLGGYPVREIASNAVNNCNSITGITIAESVQRLGNGVFANCKNLEYVKCIGFILVIPDNAFKGCGNLTKIEFIGPTEEIGAFAFADCSNLREIDIPYTVNSIGDYAFSGCTNLNIFSFSGTSDNKIRSGQFKNCLSIKRFYLPLLTEQVETQAFESCTNLQEIYIPAQVNLINSQAFSDCTSLTDVFFAGSEEEWKKIEIKDDNTPLLNATIHYNYYAPESSLFLVSSHIKQIETTLYIDSGVTQNELYTRGRIQGSSIRIKDKEGNILPLDILPGTGMIFSYPFDLSLPIVVPGDIDGDGVITASDARLVLRASVGLEGLSEDSVQFKAADVSKDNELSAADARLILRASVGLEDTKEWL